MSIVPFPADRARGTDPEPTPPSTAKRSVRAARGIELQTAREAAGFTHESLARRITTLMRLRTHDGVLLERDERWVQKLTRQLEFMERLSQATYDRSAAWHAVPYAERPAKGRPRVAPREYDKAFAAIAIGNAHATLAELRDARQALTAADRVVGREERREYLNRRGYSIACLVWNHADDADFLDRALIEELSGSGEYGDTRIDRWRAYLVRAVLCEIANELRVMFPQRPRMDVDRRDAA